MSVEEELTIAVLMQFVTTSRDPTTAHVTPGTWETDGTVQVMNTQIHRGSFGKWGKNLDKFEFYS